MLKEGIILGERYEIISRIGSGGMADVYKAEDHKLNRKVAVKVMKPEFREDTSFVARFQKEAQAAARLSHPNVVNVYDVGEDRKMNYIVMELIEGITLKRYISKKGKLSVREATSIAIQVSLGLQAAHNQGIVHRDVKPQNIIISTDGKVKLSDFGIAKAINSNTITANVMGSVHYSSPEQVRGGVSDAKSDIYSLGVTMYEMVTGHVPYDGDSTVSIAIKHLQEEVIPPSRFTPDLSYSLEQIIIKCMQKDPNRRYFNVGELIEDLKRSLSDPQGNFVQIAPLSDHASTVTLSGHEQDEINRQMDREYDREYDRDYDRGYDREYDNRRYEDTYPPEYDYEEEGSSKLEKTITIAGILIGAVIIIILVLVIGNMTGLFHFGKSKDALSSSESVISASSLAGNQEEKGKITVPDLTSMTLKDAEKKANELGLGIREIQESSAEVPEGQVFSQDPQAGEKVDPHTTITVKVSTGEDLVTIPTGLSGAKQAQAEETLKGVGLTPEIVLENSESVETGVVISVDPSEGTKVAPDSRVTLTVSKGAEDTTVTMPNLAGISEASAKTMLDNYGLSYTTIESYTNTLNEGDVIRTEPTAGTKITTGDTVKIYVNTKAADPNAGDVNGGAEGAFVCYNPLSQPNGYSGGKVRLELVQGDTKTVFYDGDNPWANGPYSDPVYSDKGDTGTINIYEDGNYIGHYQNVQFQKVS